MLKEALLLPWIEKLPGEKRVRFVNGQIFVVQKYVGCQLIRAHIRHDEGLTVFELSDNDRLANTNREVGLAYAR